MSFDTTMTEQDMDANAQQLVQSLRAEGGEMEPDLAVDGLSESLLSRIIGLFGRSKA